MDWQVLAEFYQKAHLICNLLILLLQFCKSHTGCPKKFVPFQSLLWSNRCCGAAINSHFKIPDRRNFILIVDTNQNVLKFYEEV